jgi:hypothetical protein
MALNSQGSKISHGNGASPEVFTQIEEVTSIGGPDGSAPLIDVSHLQSTRKEYLQGLADGGQVQLECNFIAGAQQMSLFTMFNNTADPESFRIEIPTDSTRSAFHQFDFQGIVTKWSLADAVDAKVKLNVTLQTTGGVVYTAPA